MIALDLQHRGIVDHTLEVESFGRELEALEHGCNVLHHDVVIDVSDELDNVETLNLAVDHHFVFF